jgi:Asp-tRNA(Asn)/Glu-tRNA(Gln) amidotransferase A subunit family amidase
VSAGGSPGVASDADRGPPSSARRREATAAELAASIGSGEVSVTEIALALVERIESREPTVRAWAFLDPELVRAGAGRLDESAPVGPLHGVPIGIKDLIDTADMPTELGSGLYEGRRPWVDAPCVAALRRAGALVVGKTVTTELGLYAVPPTRNPLRESRTPGGSSAGSAAAVADSMVPVALGTQTAGSVIRPASYCGVFGFVPTRGRWEMSGIKAVSPSFDRLGIFARTLDDVRLVASALGGSGARRGRAPKSERRARIGVLEAVDEIVPGFSGALEPVGTVTRTSGSTALALAPSAHDTLMRAEVARAMAFELAHAGHLTGATRAFLEESAAVDESSVAEALLAAEACRREVESLFGELDVLIAPSASGEAPPAPEGTGDPFHCRTWSLLGLPSVSLPVARGPSGLPVGVQVIGQRGRDALTLALGESIYRATGAGG